MNNDNVMQTARVIKIFDDMYTDGNLTYYGSTLKKTVKLCL